MTASTPDTASTSTLGGRLALLRHGESTFNAEGKFTGILDVPLTGLGRQEANRAAQTLAEWHFHPDEVFTSRLTRAQDTTQIVLAALGFPPVPVHAVWELNERNYGGLTGELKSDVVAKYDKAQFREWRRTLHGRPPAMDANMQDALHNQPAFRGLPDEAVSPTETLDDVRARVAVFWRAELLPKIVEGKTVLVVAHGNSLRALCMVVDDLTEQEVIDLNIPTGYPLVYHFDREMRPVPRGGRYLEPDAAHRAAQKVADAGGT